MDISTQVYVLRAENDRLRNTIRERDEDIKVLRSGIKSELDNNAILKNRLRAFELAWRSTGVVPWRFTLSYVDQED